MDLKPYHTLADQLLFRELQINILQYTTRWSLQLDHDKANAHKGSNR